MTTHWNKSTVAALYALPFFELIHQAHVTHREHFKSNEMELCTLLSIKTGACPEDCAYCPQSGHYKTGVEKEKLLSVEAVVEQAKIAKQNGAKRFCMGAAWRNPPKREFDAVCRMVKEVKALGLETCVTLGMLDQPQAQQLKTAGLDYYNHNLDTSPDYYKKIITTRSYESRLDTLEEVRQAGIRVCCGGIVGMGETREDRIAFLLTLAALPEAPDSIPVNQLIPAKGTPLENQAPLDQFEFIRTIAVARIMFPTSMVRLSAGRDDMSDEMQAWCFMAGANSIFYGDTLLTAQNAQRERDLDLLERLSMLPVRQRKQSPYAIKNQSQQAG